MRTLRRQSDGTWQLPVQEAALQLTTAGWELIATFLVQDEPVVVARIESGASVNGTAVEASPAGFCSLAARLDGVAVLEGVASPDGNLRIRLSTGESLNVAADEAVESWNLTTSSGDRIVSMPGGTLAVWTTK